MRGGVLAGATEAASIGRDQLAVEGHEDEAARVPRGRRSARADSRSRTTTTRSSEVPRRALSSSGASPTRSASAPRTPSSTGSAAGTSASRSARRGTTVARPASSRRARKSSARRPAAASSTTTHGQTLPEGGRERARELRRLLDPVGEQPEDARAGARRVSRHQRPHAGADALEARCVSESECSRERFWPPPSRAGAPSDLVARLDLLAQIRELELRSAPPRVGLGVPDPEAPRAAPTSASTSCWRSTASRSTAARSAWSFATRDCALVATPLEPSNDRLGPRDARVGLADASARLLDDALGLGGRGAPPLELLRLGIERARSLVRPRLEVLERGRERLALARERRALRRRSRRARSPPDARDSPERLDLLDVARDLALEERAPRCRARTQRVCAPRPGLDLARASSRSASSSASRTRRAVARALVGGRRRLVELAARARAASRSARASGATRREARGRASRRGTLVALGLLRLPLQRRERCARSPRRCRRRAAGSAASAPSCARRPASWP